MPRERQAPDGGQEGGTQPTASSRSNRRRVLAPTLPRPRGKKHDADVKNLLPTLDIGSHINAAHQVREMAGATQERTLFPVTCMRLLGPALSHGPAPFPHTQEPRADDPAEAVRPRLGVGPVVVVGWPVCLPVLGVCLTPAGPHDEAQRLRRPRRLIAASRLTTGPVGYSDW